MVDTSDLQFTSHMEFSTPDHTAGMAAALGARLHAGDVLLLEGPVGAGKTHFARALIQSILIEFEDVPSPTFTLVQTYETTRGTLWHTDLYRIGSVYEIEELGLFEAFETSICLVEWPDRLGETVPKDALHLNLRQGKTDETRLVEVTSFSDKWAERLHGWAL